MSKSLFRDKYVRKFQQGGGTITPLNPNVFRTPMQTIDSSMFAKTISPGVDINILINENARRENAALAREKMKHDFDLLDRKAQLEEDSKIFEMIMGELSSTGGTPNTKAGTPTYYNNDITTSKRFEQDKIKHTEKSNQIMDAMLKARSLPGDQKLSTIFKLKNDYVNHMSSFPANALLKTDELIYKRALDIASDPKSKFKINKSVFNDWVTKRNSWLNMEPGTEDPNYYKLGEEPIGLYYDYDATRKRFEDFITTLNTPVAIGKEVVKDGNIIKEREVKTLLDTETAADRGATAIIADRDLLSFMQDQYGLNLTVPPGQENSLKNTIKEILKNNIQFDDAAKSGGTYYEESYKGMMPSTETKKSEVRYITDSDGNQVEVDENTYNRINVQDFTNRHFNPETGVMNVESAANDPDLNNATLSLINVLIPPLSGPASETFSKLSGEVYGYLTQITKEFLLAGGLPNSPEYLDIIKPMITQVLSGDLYGAQVQESIDSMKERVTSLNGKGKWKNDPSWLLAPIGISVPKAPASGSTGTMDAKRLAEESKKAMGSSTGTIPDYAKNQ